MIKGFTFALAVFFLLCTVLFPAPASRAADPVKVGVILSATGIAAPHNQPLLEMVQMAVEEINRRGGVLGRLLQLTVIDNESTPIGSRRAAETAVDMGVAAVIGAHWSSHSMAIAPVLQAAGIPMISPGSTNPAITAVGDYVFRVCFVDSFQGRAMARFARQELHAGTAAVIRNIDEAYSISLADFFGAAFVENGGTIAVEAGYRGKATDFSEPIATILHRPVDVVYLPGYTRDSGLFIRQARKMGVSAVFLGGDAWDEVETYAADAVEGAFQSAPWHPEVPFPESDSLKRIYELKFGEPIRNMSAPLAYDAVLLLSEAIERAGSVDRTAIRNALGATNGFRGATGEITFDAQGDPVDKEVIIIKFEKGKRQYYTTIKP